MSADNGDGRGILWGMCFADQRVKRKIVRSQLLRFDCSLSRDLERPSFKLPKDYTDLQYLAFPMSENEKHFLVNHLKEE